MSRQSGGMIPSTFSSRTAAWAWVLGTAQFLVLHFIVQLVWTKPYSWALNNVSDLGNVSCQPWGDNARDVCSPWHAWMNTAFVLEGLCIVAGVVFSSRLWGRSWTAWTARALLILAGVGYVLAGLFPADINENVHVLGALFIAVLGNMGLIMTGQSLATGYRPLRLLASGIGLVGCVATGLFFSGTYLGLGMGGMERLAVLNLQTWTLIAGLFILRSPEVMGRPQV
jgi:hypothetical membrane protein